MMGFLHLYMKYTQPLFIQGIMALKGLYDAKLIQIHIFGKPATGDLKRPFKAGGGLFGQLLILCSVIADIPRHVLTGLQFARMSYL